MANSYTQIYLQLVFAVKRRESLIHKSWREELYKYISGIATAKKHKVYAIGGVEDHIHILISCKPHLSVSEVVRDIKANSSRWINERRLTSKRFEWQNGFGAFSYSQSALGNVIRYIQNQEEHHENKKFTREYIELLNQYQIEYHEKYLFENPN